MLKERHGGLKVRTGRRWVLVAVLVAACSVRHGEPSLTAIMVRDVPFFPQEPQQCGPAALASLMSYFGHPIWPERVAEEIYEPAAGGTPTVAMTTYAARHGLPLQAMRADLADLRAEVDAGRPLIVLLRRGFPFHDAHFVVVNGYDGTSGTIYGYSGRDAMACWTTDQFARRWARADHWALVWTGEKEHAAATPPRPSEGDGDHAGTGKRE